MSDPSKPDKWRYQSPKREQKSTYTLGHFLLDIVLHLGLFVYFTILPVFVLTVLYWVCQKTFQDTFFDAFWMQPTVFMAAMFFSGVFSRVAMENFVRSMGLFIMLILGFSAYAYLCWWDIQHGNLFSISILPEPLRQSLLAYIYMLPAAGLMGSFCYKWFTFR